MEETAQTAQTALQPPTQTGITWTASEFVVHEKSAGWYGMLAVTAAAIAGVMFLITNDLVSVGVVVVAAAVLASYAARQPRQLEYRLDDQGVNVGAKRYGFQEFRSFSVLPEGAFSSIVFMPLKRWAPPTTIYFAPEDEDNILKLLSAQLPFEEARRDAVDNLMRRIRF